MATLLLAFGSLLTGAGPAVAQTVPGITAVTIQSPNPADPGQPLKVGQRFRLDATWSVPDSAAPGDTFGLSFPAAVTGFSTQFTLVSPASADPVGTCIVTAGQITCTLGQYVKDHDDVHGTLFFEATANEIVTTSPIDFTASNGVTIPVALPGGGVVGNSPGQAPTTIKKHGTLDPGGKTVAWSLLLPAKIVQMTHPAGQSFFFDDSYTPGLTVTDVVVGYITDWTATGNVHKRFAVGTAQQPNTYEFTAAANGFRITIHQPELTGQDPVYFVRYHTAVPAGAAPGTTFTNQLIYNGSVAASADVILVDAGGNGSGVQPTPVTTPPSTSPPSSGPSSSASTSNASTSAASTSGSAGIGAESTSSLSSSGGAGVDAEQTSAGLASTGARPGPELALGVGILGVGLLLMLAGRTRRRRH